MPAKKVRLLLDQEIDGIQYTADTALEIDAARAKILVKDGNADDDKPAVEYALSLGALVVHAAAPAEPEPAEATPESAADPTPAE